MLKNGIVFNLSILESDINIGYSEFVITVTDRDGHCVGYKEKVSDSYLLSRSYLDFLMEKSKELLKRHLITEE